LKLHKIKTKSIQPTQTSTKKNWLKKKHNFHNAK